MRLGRKHGSLSTEHEQTNKQINSYGTEVISLERTISIRSVKQKLRNCCCANRARQFDIIAKMNHVEQLFDPKSKNQVDFRID